MGVFLIIVAARSYSRFKSKTILKSLTCRCLAVAMGSWSVAAYQKLARTLEVFGRIDTERHALDDLDIDAHAGFESA
jgi:hypothetical protein